MSRKAAETETYRADPDKLKPDREIRYQLVGNGRNRLEVLNARPDRVYAWIRAYHRDGTYDTQEVYAKQAVRVKDASGNVVAAWDVVNAADQPDIASDVKPTPEGYRRIGDCILMDCDRDVARFIEQEQREEAARREGRTMDGLREMGGGIIPFRSFHSHPKNFYGQPNRDQASFERMLREGTAPGMDPRNMPRG